MWRPVLLWCELLLYKWLPRAFIIGAYFDRFCCTDSSGEGRVNNFAQLVPGWGPPALLLNCSNMLYSCVSSLCVMLRTLSISLSTDHWAEDDHRTQIAHQPLLPTLPLSVIFCVMHCASSALHSFYVCAIHLLHSATWLGLPCPTQHRTPSATMVQSGPWQLTAI